MFGWGKKSDAEIVNTVCANVHPLFILLEARLVGLPRELVDDPFVIGFIVAAAMIFAQIESNGKATQAQKGLAALSAIQAAFMAYHLTQQDASAAMQKFVNHPEAKRGSRAADLMLGVAAGMTDKDNEPEIVAAKRAVAEMPTSIREMLSGTPQSLLIHELQEQLFFAPLVVKYKRA